MRSGSVQIARHPEDRSISAHGTPLSRRRPAHYHPVRYYLSEGQHAGGTVSGTARIAAPPADDRHGVLGGDERNHPVPVRRRSPREDHATSRRPVVRLQARPGGARGRGRQPGRHDCSRHSGAEHVDPRFHATQPPGLSPVSRSVPESGPFWRRLRKGARTRRLQRRTSFRPTRSKGMSPHS